MQSLRRVQFKKFYYLVNSMNKKFSQDIKPVRHFNVGIAEIYVSKSRVSVSYINGCSFKNLKMIFSNSGFTYLGNFNCRIKSCLYGQGVSVVKRQEVFGVNKKATKEAVKLKLRAGGTIGLFLTVYGRTPGILVSTEQIKKVFNSFRGAFFIFKKKVIYGYGSRAPANFIKGTRRSVSRKFSKGLSLGFFLYGDLGFLSMKKGGSWTPSSFARCIMGSGSCSFYGGGHGGPQKMGFASTHKLNTKSQEFEQAQGFIRPIINKLIQECWTSIHDQLLGGAIFSTGGSVNPYQKDNHELFIRWDEKIEAYHVFALKSNPLCNGEHLTEEDGMFFVGNEPLISSKQGEGTFLHYVGPHDAGELKKIIFHEQPANKLERMVDKNNPRELHIHIKDGVLNRILSFDYATWAYRFRDDSFAIKKSRALAEKMQAEFGDSKDSAEL